MNRFHLPLLLTLSVCFIAPAVAAAQDKPADKPAAPAAADTADVKVLEVKGKARYRLGPDQPWQPVTTDSPVTRLSEFQTAANSHVKLQVGPNSQVILKGLGTLTIAQVATNENDNVITTRLAQKYGRVNVEVQHVGQMRNDYKIATPGMVLAVKGSGGNVYSYGGTFNVEWKHGNAEQETDEGTNDVEGGDNTDNNNQNPNDNRNKESNFTNNFQPDPSNSNNNQDPNQGYGGNRYTNNNQPTGGVPPQNNQNSYPTIPNNSDGGGDGGFGEGGETPPL